MTTQQSKTQGASIAHRPAGLDPAADDSFLNRSLPLLTRPGIEKLARTKVVVAGCGGVGGGMAVTLCRMGVGEFHLADPADFDPPDMNRQWGATRSALGRNKADVYRDILHDINPDCRVTTFEQGITDDNHDEFLDGADVLVDCLDASVPYNLRETLHNRTRARGVFSCVGPILGFGCFALCSSPDGESMDFWTETFRDAKTRSTLPPRFYDIFTPEHLDVVVQSLQAGKVPTLAVGPLIATSLLTTEVVAHLLNGVVPGGRPAIVLPRAMFFDLYRMNYSVVDVRSLSTRTEAV